MKYSTPINEAVEDFLESVDKAESTKTLYRRTLSYWIRWATSNDAILEPKVSHAIFYRDHLRNRGLSPASIDNYMASVRALFAWLVKYDYYGVNITTEIKKEKSRDRVYIKQCLTLEQVEQLIESTGEGSIIEKRNRTIIKIMVLTGLRCIEIQRLNCGDLRQSAEGSFLQVWRKGEREAGGALRMPDEVVQSINNYLLSRNDEVNMQAPMFVCHGPRSRDSRLQTVFISQMIKAHLRKIGLDSRQYSAHSLRHTAASLALLAGAELYEIQFMLGQRDINQTERYLKSLGRAIGNEGSAISKIEQFVKEYRKKIKNQQNSKK